MKDQDVLVSTMLLIHQNQVALAESVQGVSKWLQNNGAPELTQSIQAKMELVLGNSLSINYLLVELDKRLLRAADEVA